MSEHKPAIRIVTVADPHWEVVVFTKPDGGAEAVITSPDSPKKPVHITIDPAPEGMRLVTMRHPDGTVEVFYRDAADA
jgi:hypothetical protein